MKHLKLRGMIGLSCLLVAVCAISVFAASSASVSINKTQAYVDSNAVGLGMAASFSANNSMSSDGTLQVLGMACWAGWPYSVETSTNLAIGQSASLYDTQSQSSSFKIRLSGRNRCIGNGSVVLH